MPRDRRRQIFALTWAVFTGLALGLLDSSPGFDATGITAGGLVIAGAVSALIDGSGALNFAAAYAIVCAAGIFGLEQTTTGAGAGAVIFAAIGALATAAALRLAKSRASP